MTLAEWKKKVIELQGFDAFGKPFITQSGMLCFEWNGYTYGCMGDDEEPFLIPPSTSWLGIDAKTVTEFKGEIDWNQEVAEEGIKIQQPEMA